MKVAVIGSASSVAGFRALGVDAFTVSRPEEASDVWGSMEPEQYGVIFITEDLQDVLAPELEHYGQRAFPVITMIPPATGGEGSGVERLRLLVEKAVGTDMLSGDQENQESSD